jgi:hypothetical protein
LHSEAAPLLTWLTQQTVPVAQFAALAHLSAATSPPPPPPGCGQLAPATHAYDRAPPPISETQQLLAGIAHVVAPQVMLVVLPPGPASGGLMPPSAFAPGVPEVLPLDVPPLLDVLPAPPDVPAPEDVALAEPVSVDASFWEVRSVPALSDPHANSANPVKPAVIAPKKTKSTFVIGLPPGFIR